MKGEKGALAYETKVVPAQWVVVQLESLEQPRKRSGLKARRLVRVVGGKRAKACGRLVRIDWKKRARCPLSCIYSGETASD
jgi:hypothetical protein